MLGLNINKQKLSGIWRRTFYAGIIIHKMLKDEVVVGKWEPLVSQEDFLKVQFMLDNGNTGYQQAEIDNNRPLQKFIICGNCGAYMTGYKAKGLYDHYKCSSNCKGYDMNANTTVKSPKEGLNNLFIDFIDTYKIDSTDVIAVREQLKIVLLKLQGEKADNSKILNVQLKELQKQKEDLEEKYALSGMRAEIFEKFDLKLAVKIEEIKAKLGSSVNLTSNLDENIEKGVEIIENISKHYISEGVEMKSRIQKLVFPEGDDPAFGKP